MPLTLDPLQWALNYALTSVAQVATTRFRNELHERVIAQVEAWVAPLPVGAELEPKSLFAISQDAVYSSAARSRLASTLQRERLTTASEWFEALFERWNEVRAELPELDRAPFFNLPDEEARLHLTELAELLNDVVARDLNRILPELARRTEHLIPRSVERNERVVLTASVSGADAHSEIDAAFSHVPKGRPDKAIEALNSIKNRRWDHLSDRERYRLLANRGRARLTSQDKLGAANDYLSAAAHQKNDEEARALASLGHLLLGEREKAAQIALQLCKEYPNFSRAHMLRIRTANVEEPLEEILDATPLSVRGDPEVALALHDRAAAADELSLAEEILRECRGADEWVHIPLALGTTLLQRELSELRATSAGVVLSNESRLQEAVELFGRVLESIPDTDPEELALSTLLNRGAARRLLGQLDLAREDFLSAQKLQPNDERVVVALAGGEHPDRSELESAIKLLETYLEKNASIASELLLAELLLQRGDASDHQRALEIGGRLISRMGEVEEKLQRAAVAEIFVELSLREDRGEEALVRLEAVSETQIGGPTKHVLRGRLLYELGRKDDAVVEAEQARKALGQSAEWFQVRRVALLFESLQRYGDALEMWRRISRVDYVGAETYHTLYCASRQGEHLFLLEHCEKLRAAGFYDQITLSYEVETLVRYSEFTRARSVLLSYLSAKPKDKVARLNLTTLALYQGWADLVVNDPEELPAADEVTSAAVGARVVDVLRLGPDPTRALDYAYDLYRRFPDTPETQRALILVVLAPSRSGLQVGSLSKVAPGVAVRFQEDGDEQDRWLIVEDASEPSISRNEYPSSHPLVCAMAGKEMGQGFGFPKSFHQRSGKIMEIKDKRIYRAHELMHSWPDRFPEIPFLQAITIIEDDSATPDFSALVQILEATAEPRNRLLSFYSEQRLPVSTFARFRRWSVFQIMEHLALSRDLKVHASSGRTGELEGAMEVLNNTASVVLDPTAVATLALLEEVEVLAALPFECVVSEGTLQELRDLARDDPPHGQGGLIGMERGQLRLQDVSEEEEDGRRGRIKAALDVVERTCVVIGGADVARIEVGFRRDLEDVLVRGSAEAVAAASIRSSTWWTDDHLLHLLVERDLPAVRVWTQAVFIWMHRRGFISAQHVSRVTARLLRFGYIFTTLNAHTVVEVLESASWRVENRDVMASLADFGNPAWDASTALTLTAQTLSKIWREAPSEDHARAATNLLLANLATRGDYREIIRNVLRDVEGLLGLAVTRTDALRAVLRGLLQSGVLISGPAQR